MISESTPNTSEAAQAAAVWGSHRMLCLSVLARCNLSTTYIQISAFAHSRPVLRPSVLVIESNG